MNKKILSLLLATIAVATTFVGCAKPKPTPAQQSQEQPEATQEVSQTKAFKIGIIQSVEHAALDASREGFIAALKDKGLEVEYDYQNAQGEQANLKTIAAGFVAKNVDMAFAIATDAAQTMVGETTTIPILFTAVTDPLSAGIVVDTEKPGANVSGTSDISPISKQIDFIKALYPDLETLGIMYTSSETNSEVQAKIAIEYCESIGIKTQVLTSAAVTDISAVTESLIKKSQAIFIPTDNQIASAMASVAKVAEPLKFPVFAAEPGMTKEGGLATLGINYHNLGYQTGLMAYEVLVNKAFIGTLKVEPLKQADYYLNQRTADAIGFEFPQEFVSQAAEIWK